jgi:hypothetical protein
MPFRVFSKIQKAPGIQEEACHPGLNRASCGDAFISLERL